MSDRIAVLGLGLLPLGLGLLDLGLCLLELSLSLIQLGSYLTCTRDRLGLRGLPSRALWQGGRVAGQQTMAGQQTIADQQTGRAMRVSFAQQPARPQAKRHRLRPRSLHAQTSDLRRGAGASIE